VSVPQPGPDQVLIRAAASSLNPLEYKLAVLNFFGRTPPVVLGLDLSGIVVDIGRSVRDHPLTRADSVLGGLVVRSTVPQVPKSRHGRTRVNSQPGVISHSRARSIGAPRCWVTAFRHAPPGLAYRTCRAVRRPGRCFVDEPCLSAVKAPLMAIGSNRIELWNQPSACLLQTTSLSNHLTPKPGGISPFFLVE
jgi:hypothetical protein